MNKVYEIWFMLCFFLCSPIFLTCVFRIWIVLLKAGMHIYARAAAKGKRIQVTSCKNSSLLFQNHSMSVCLWNISSVKYGGEKSWSCPTWCQRRCYFECATCCWIWCRWTEMHGSEYCGLCWQFKIMVPLTSFLHIQTTPNLCGTLHIFVFILPLIFFSPLVSELHSLMCINRI